MIKGATHNLIVRTRSEVALYMLNHKRAHLRELEERFRLTITVSADASVAGEQSYIIDRGEQVHSAEAARSLAAAAQAAAPVEATEEEPFEAEAEAEAERRGSKPKPRKRAAKASAKTAAAGAGGGPRPRARPQRRSPRGRRRELHP